MDFAAAWDTLEIGDRVTVSNGLPEPSNPIGMSWKLWRSHNFEGELVERIDGDWRCMRFELDASLFARVSYSIVEGIGHVIEPVTPPPEDP